MMTQTRERESAGRWASQGQQLHNPLVVANVWIERMDCSSGVCCYYVTLYSDDVDVCSSICTAAGHCTCAVVCGRNEQLTRVGGQAISVPFFSCTHQFSLNHCDDRVQSDCLYR